MSQVSVPICFRLTNVCRFEFYSSALTAGSIDPMETFGDIWRVSGWLRGVGVYPVSDSVFSCLIDVSRS